MFLYRNSVPGWLKRAAIALLLSAGSAPAVSAATNAADDMRSASMVDAPDLAAACRPDAVEAVASRLSIKVVVKQIANGPNFAGGTRYVAATAKVPAFCQVTGSFVTNPATGKTANFEATFPAAWNRKYLQYGCSGHCGQFAVSDPAVPVITITAQGYPAESIIKGYSSFATDEGHEGFSGGSWDTKGPGKIDDDALEDFLYRADKVLASMGKEFTKAFYSQATGAAQTIRYSYFCGCSGGGRDALVAAAYFPEEFDGIVAGSAYANAAGVALQAAGASLAAIRTPDARISPAQIAQIDSLVLAKCDAVDGVKDGLIQNPGACNFRPEKDLPRCQDNKPGPDCFTNAQIESVSTLVTAVTDEHGNVVQPGYSISGLQGVGLTPPANPAAPDPWVDNGNPTAGLGSLADAVIKTFAHRNDPDFHTRSLISFGSGGSGQVTDYRIIVPAKAVKQIETAISAGIGNDPAKAARLIHSQRKLLIWSNLSDQLLTPYMSINYYKRLAKMYGGYAKLQKNVRLFMVPGTAHCSMAGDGPGSFDAIGALENWVEKGKGPDALVAGLYPAQGFARDFSAAPLRSMPLCKFPEKARYSGHGDVKDAGNWSCPASDKSMLKIGESGKQAGEIR